MSQELEDKLTLLDDLQSSCTGCGLCSEGCMTFLESGWEHDSPRGRLKLAGELLHGNIVPSAEGLSTFDRCLGCRSCESLCPLNVSYREIRIIVQDVRREFSFPLAPSSVMKRLDYKRWITLAYRIGNHWWRRYGWRWLQVPAQPQNSEKVVMPNCNKSSSAVLAVCCAQQLYHPQLIQDTLSFFRQLGVSLIVDQKQPCCGFIFERLIHGGKESLSYPKEQNQAVKYQKQSIRAFSQWLEPNTFFLSSGCQQFAGNPLDLYRWIETLLDENELKLTFPQKQEVYYQPYCNKRNKLQDDPAWSVLNRVENLSVRLIQFPEACCGGYCGETLLHPTDAESFAIVKLKKIPDRATLIITSPDCWGHYLTFNQQDLEILYPIQLLCKAALLHQ